MGRRRQAEPGAEDSDDDSGTSAATSGPQGASAAGENKKRAARKEKRRLKQQEEPASSSSPLPRELSGAPTAHSKKGGRGKEKRPGNGGGRGVAPNASLIEAHVSPAQVRFAHARIKPVFSGCGRRLEDTLADLRAGTTRVEDLPPITVLTHPGDGEEGWLFSLNNRRLWVFKQLHAEGHLETVRVRMRPVKPHEAERYTVERCALHARLVANAGAARRGGGRPTARGGGVEGEGGDAQSSDDAEDVYGGAVHLGQRKVKNAVRLAAGGQGGDGDDDDDGSSAEESEDD
jgi:hypothetical protein